MESHWSICYWMKQQWLQCYNAWNSTEHNGIKWNVSGFIVLFNGIPLQAMLLKGTSMNCMFHWKSIPRKSMLLKGASVKSRIEHQWIQLILNGIQWSPMLSNGISMNSMPYWYIPLSSVLYWTESNCIYFYMERHPTAVKCNVILKGTLCNPNVIECNLNELSDGVAPRSKCN